MTKDRRAHAVLFGFDFQVNAAIVLMLDYIIELEYLRLEGNFEDIELTLSEGKTILAQAKAIERASSDFQNVRKNLEKALASLSEGCKDNPDVKKVIFITNSPNPLREEASSKCFYGLSYRDYSTLPSSSQKLIKRYLSKINCPLDLGKFMILVLPFETDDKKERYKEVRKAVDDFVGDLNINIPGLGKKLLAVWQTEVFHNGTKKDVSIRLSKKDIIWPVIVIATDIERADERVFDWFDCSAFDEITHKYKTLIDTCSERFEFVVKVLSDYNSYKSSKKESEKPFDFAFNKCKLYEQELDMGNIDKESRRGVVQLILYKIVANRITISRVKKAVNL
jgi:hypothetical protein